MLVVSSYLDKDTECLNGKGINHPIIQKILIGSKLCKGEIEKYLRTVNQNGHKVKHDGQKKVSILYMFSSKLYMIRMRIRKKFLELCGDRF